MDVGQKTFSIDPVGKKDISDIGVHRGIILAMNASLLANVFEIHIKFRLADAAQAISQAALDQLGNLWPSEFRDKCPDHPASLGLDLIKMEGFFHRQRFQ